MYFLAHMFLALKALPGEYFKDEIIEPLIIGSWCPDAGYFPHFSWKMKIFSHTEKPPIFFYNDEQRKRAFLAGWETHIAIDKIIHKQPFFKNNAPFCNEIETRNGLKRYLTTAKGHLGREIGVDLLIKKGPLQKEPVIMSLLTSKSTYCKPKISFQGFRLLKKYVYQYINIALPILSNEKFISEKLQKIINYELFEKEEVKKKIEKMLENAKKVSEGIIKEKLDI